MPSTTVLDGYCNFCGNASSRLSDTKDGKAICELCTTRERFCEICGSVRAYETQSRQEQLHYNELCFK